MQGRVMLSEDDKLQVWMSFLWDALSQVDTVNMTAYIKCMVTLEWHDPRAVGWKGSAMIPGGWGVQCRLLNSVGDMQRTLGDVKVADKATGLMQRQLWFEGSVSNFMDVKNFPLDVDDVVINFVVSEGCPCRNGEAVGSRVGFTSNEARILPVRGPNALNVFWGGHISEYELLDWTVATQSVGAVGQNAFEYVDVSFRIARKPNFYFWKALMPLYFLTVFSLAPFVFGEATADRMNFSSTMFLAAFAVLYGATVPTLASIRTARLSSSRRHYPFGSGGREPAEDGLYTYMRLEPQTRRLILCQLLTYLGPIVGIVLTAIDQVIVITLFMQLAMGCETVAVQVLLQRPRTGGDEGCPMAAQAVEAVRRRLRMDAGGRTEAAGTSEECADAAAQLDGACLPLFTVTYFLANVIIFVPVVAKHIQLKRPRGRDFRLDTKTGQALTPERVTGSWDTDSGNRLEEPKLVSRLAARPWLPACCRNWLSRLYVRLERQGVLDPMSA